MLGGGQLPYRCVTLQSVIETYGYAAVLVGTFLEGETVLVLAGFAAHRGYLDWTLVALTAFVGSVLGDQLYFFLGRRYGRDILARFPGMQARAGKVQRLLERYHTPIILVLRFLYGLRTVGPIAIGMSRVPWLRFLVLNMISAVAWSVSIAGAGFLFGNVLQALFADIHHYEKLGFVAIVVGGIAAWIIVWLRSRKR